MSSSELRKIASTGSVGVALLKLAGESLFDHVNSNKSLFNSPVVRNFPEPGVSTVYSVKRPGYSATYKEGVTTYQSGKQVPSSPQIIGGAAAQRRVKNFEQSIDNEIDAAWDRIEKSAPRRPANKIQPKSAKEKFDWTF